MINFKSRVNVLLTCILHTAVECCFQLHAAVYCRW